MSWTRADSKDVLRKALGTLIAAGLIAIGSALIEVLTPLVLAIIMFSAALLIFIILWKAKDKEPRVIEPARTGIAYETTPDLSQRESSKTASEVRSIEDERLARMPAVGGEQVPYEQKRLHETPSEKEYKLKKKAMKAQQKAQKKAEKK